MCLNTIIMPVVFCPNKQRVFEYYYYACCVLLPNKQHPFEPFMCSDTIIITCCVLLPNKQSPFEIFMCSDTIIMPVVFCYLINSIPLNLLCIWI